MERYEALSVMTGILRARLAGEPMPQFDSPEFERFAAALPVLAEQAATSDFHELGLATLRMLSETMQASLRAEKLMLEGQIAARRAPGGVSS